MCQVWCQARYTISFNARDSPVKEILFRSVPVNRLSGKGNKPNGNTDYCLLVFASSRGVNAPTVAD